MPHCKICGEWNCKKHTALIGRAAPLQEFSGSSPPEIFVGRWNYPNVYTGILSPDEHGNTEEMSSAEIWHKQRFPIPHIMSLRNKLIYGRIQTNVKRAPTDKKFLSVMQEIAMSSKSVSAEYKLKKPVSRNPEQDLKVPLMPKAAPIEKVRLQENVQVNKKVDYLVSDNEVKSTTALVELEKSNITTSSLIKLLTAGLLGLKRNRRLVPTRWAITAVDDTISKEKLKSIRLFPEVKEISVFHSEYLGNYYEFLVLPSKWEFEVIEISLKTFGAWHDYETFFPRKKYAESVTGAYYANRLALTEYLERIKRQGACIVFREVRPEYYAPLGVGILRQISRDAFASQPKIFNTIKEALADIQSRLKQPVTNYTEKSFILKNYGKQRKISEYF